MNDENVYYEEKKPSFAGIVLRRTVYGLMILILGILALRLFSTREPGSVKKLYLDSSAEKLKSELKKDFKFYQVNVLDFITSDGLYHISYVYYLESSNQLQLTVRNKQDNLADPKATEPLDYELSSQSGSISKGIYVNTEYRFNYRFDTIVFDNVYIGIEEDEEAAGSTGVTLEIFAGNPRESLGHLTVYDKNVMLKPKRIMSMKTIKR